MKQVILFSAISAYKFIYLYMQNITRVSPVFALCFIFGAMLLFVGIFFYFKLALKDNSKSIVISLIVMCALSLNITNIVLVPVIAVGFCIIGYVVLRYLDAEKILAFLKPFGITLLVLSAINGAAMLIKDNFNIITPTLKVEKFKDIKIPNRNIYIILLDAHAGKRTIKHFGGDNSDFINKLKQRGFTVFEDMESNYNKTIISIPSFLNAAYIDELSYTTPSDAINNAVLFRLAKNAGYNIHYLNSWPLDVHIQGKIIDDTYSIQDDAFQTVTELFIGRTAWFELFNFNTTNEAKNIQKTFEYANGVFKKNIGKHLFFAHFLMPHMPYVYDKNGNVNPYSKTHDFTVNDFTVIDKNTYLEYLKFADDKTLEFVDEIFAKKGKKPIIVILGDHGARPVDYYQVERKYTKEAKENYKYYFNTFLAYYNPDMNPENYSNVKSLINFSINFQNEVFGTKLNNVEDKHYYLLEPVNYIPRLESLEAKY